jgi:hypothetical protein
VNAGAPSSGSSQPRDGNENDDPKGEEHMQGGERVPRKEKGTKDKKGNEKGNCIGKGIVKQTPRGGDISHGVALQLLKDMYEADSDREGKLELA